MMKGEMRAKKLLSFALCAALLFCGSAPTGAFAANGGCAHVHGESCGYIQAEEGTPCKHELGRHKVNGAEGGGEGPLGATKPAVTARGPRKSPAT